MGELRKYPITIRIVILAYILIRRIDSVLSDLLY